MTICEAGGGQAPFRVSGRSCLWTSAATLAISALVCGLHAAPAWAQANDSGEETVLETIQVSGDGKTEPGNGQVVVTSEDLERISPADLQDVFRGEPAVSVGSSLPISQKIYVDGIEETNLNVTIDGSRQNNKIFHHNATTYIDPSMLKAVRVDPGVAPADAGPGAIGGSIAFETRDARDMLEPGKAFGGTVSAGYETNGQIFTTSGSAYGALDGFEVLGYLKYANGENFSDGDGREIPGSAANLLSGLGKIAYESADGHRFSVSYENVRDNEMRPNRADFIFNPPRPNVRYDLRRQNVVFKYTQEKPVGLWDPEVVLAYGVTDLAADLSNEDSQGTTSSFNGKAQNTFAFDLGTITAGFDFYSDKAEYRGTSIVAAEKAHNIGGFTQARLNVTDRARLSFGARADFQQFYGNNGFKDSNSGVSANISGEYDITSFLTASAGYAHSWGGVSLAENYLVYNPGWDYENGIKPVTSDNMFAGLKADFGDFYIDGRVFRTKIHNARSLLSAASPIQLKDVESKGYEVGVGYNWGTGFVRAGFADIRATIDGVVADSYTGRYLTTPFGKRFTIGGAHTFANDQLTVGADVEIVMDYDTGTVELPGYTVVNAHLEYVPTAFDHLTLRAEVKNLFDETYADRATYGQDFPGSVIPLNEPGRSFAFKVTARF